MGTRLLVGLLGTFYLFSSIGAQAADPEKEAYKACFGPLGIKLDAKTEKGPIEDVRDAYIEALQDRTADILGWYPNMSFSKSKALKEAFEKKGRDTEVFDLMAEQYGKAMPNVLRQANANMQIYLNKLNAKESKDPGHIKVTRALDDARITIADAMMLNRLIEKKLQTVVEDDLSRAIEKNFKWDKPRSTMTRAERLDFFISGFITQKVTLLREAERKNGEGLIPHRQVPPERHGDVTPPMTHR